MGKCPGIFLSCCGTLTREGLTMDFRYFISRNNQDLSCVRENCVAFVTAITGREMTTIDYNRRAFLNKLCYNVDDYIENYTHKIILLRYSRID